MTRKILLIKKSQPVLMLPELVWMIQPFQIQHPVTKDRPATADAMMVKIFHHNDLIPRHPPYFTEQYFWIRHMMQHRDQKGHIKALVRKRDPGTIINNDRRFLITGLHDIHHEVFVAPPFKRLAIKPPAAAKIEDPAVCGNLIFKKPGDLFSPPLERAMKTITHKPVQCPSQKGL